jgi:hypothetical protein
MDWYPSDVSVVINIAADANDPGHRVAMNELLMDVEKWVRAALSTAKWSMKMSCLRPHYFVGSASRPTNSIVPSRRSRMMYMNG